MLESYGLEIQRYRKHYTSLNKDKKIIYGISNTSPSLIIRFNLTPSAISQRSVDLTLPRHTPMDWLRGVGRHFRMLR